MIHVVVFHYGVAGPYLWSYVLPDVCTIICGLQGTAKDTNLFHLAFPGLIYSSFTHLICYNSWNLQSALMDSDLVWVA